MSLSEMQEGVVDELVVLHDHGVLVLGDVPQADEVRVEVVAAVLANKGIV